MAHVSISQIAVLFNNFLIEWICITLPIYSLHLCLFMHIYFLHLQNCSTIISEIYVTIWGLFELMHVKYIVQDWINEMSEGELSEE